MASVEAGLYPYPDHDEGLYLGMEVKVFLVKTSKQNQTPISSRQSGFEGEKKHRRLFHPPEVKACALRSRKFGRSAVGVFGVSSSRLVGRPPAESRVNSTEGGVSRSSPELGA